MASQSANNNNIQLYEPDDTIAGKNYSHLVEKWTIWLYEKPAFRNPGLDSTGEMCIQDQGNVDTIFLAGTFGGVAHRRVTIPAKKNIFLAIVNTESSIAEGLGKTVQELFRSSKESIDRVAEREVMVDDVIHLRDAQLDGYRYKAGPFDLKYPVDNIYNVDPGNKVYYTPEGVTTSVNEGYFVALKPLPPGQHKIKFRGVINLIEGTRDAEYYKSDQFVSDATYDITVE